MFHLWKIMLRINWWRWPDICKKPSLYCSIVRRIKGVIIFEALLYLQQNMSLVQIRRRHVIVLLNVPTYLNKELTLGNEVQESRAERDSFFRDGTWGRARHQNMRFLVISTFLNDKHFFQSLNTKHHHRKKATIIVNPHPDLAQLNTWVPFGGCRSDGNPSHRSVVVVHVVATSCHWVRWINLGWYLSLVGSRLNQN